MVIDEDVAVQTVHELAVFFDRWCHPVVVIRCAHLVRIAIIQNPANTINKDGSILLDDLRLAILARQIGILREDFLGVDKMQFLRQRRKPRILQFGIFVHHHLFRADKDFPDLLDDRSQIVEVAIFFSNDLLPIPLIHVRTVVVVKKVVLANGTHVRVDAFMDVTLELLQRPALPLRRSLHNRRTDRHFEAQSTGEFNGCSGAVAVQHVIHTGFCINDQRYLYQHEVELFGEALFNVFLDVINCLLSALDVQQRLVIVGENFFDSLVRADTGASQVFSFVQHGSASRSIRDSSPEWAAAIKCFEER